jgi:hypothetical protein
MIKIDLCEGLMIKIKLHFDYKKIAIRIINDYKKIYLFYTDMCTQKYSKV